MGERVSKSTETSAFYENSNVSHKTVTSRGAKKYLK